MLWESLNMYDKYDPGIARAALLTFSRYLWYLTEVAVIMSFIENKVRDFEMNISTSLMKYKANEKSLPTGVPVFPVLNHTSKLQKLVKPKLWLIFHLLNSDEAWLKNNPGKKISGSKK
ncbi:hypothetical protein AVEN_123967-1 [Araneus ventricosus]|uniref:Uncharacterized protein n=1 Tax=Araneus ventricosus TaxID=182803 RepID=A0A4Y2DBZ7_ARAVE|nr:hypothetical protein AVEN_123967-1 [Araneus ventricosus]